MNRVLLTGRLTRDPEVRTTAGGKAVAQFAVATHEYVGNGKEKSEFHNVVAWDRLAETCGRYLGKGQQVALEGRLQTRSWDDDKGARHWKTEIVASSVEMLSGRRKKDYAAETAATALEAQAIAAGIEPDAAEPVADDAGFSVAPGGDDDDEEDELLEEAVAA
jgi:single-strand DNA-binding protein